MQIFGDWIAAKEVQTVLSLLTDAGYTGLLVGGCVRNALIGQPIADIDIATDALPEKIVALAQAAGIKAIPTGIDHGTVTLVTNARPFEVTTFRRDIDTDGRRAKVAFMERIEDDAARRDFTMNALYADALGHVIDPLGGLADLRAGWVRFVGRPGDRIREDYLRILRFFRFHAWYGDPAAGLNPEALAACAEHSAGLDTLSRERIGHEMRRLLGAPNPAPAIDAMQAAGLLIRVLPGAVASALAPLVRLESEQATSWLCRLASLGGDDPMERLRLSRIESRQLAILRNCTGNTAGPGELAYREGAETAREVLLLRAAVMNAPLPNGWRKQAERGAAAKFPIDAADLMPEFDGAALGAQLKKLEDRWIAADFQLSREQLLT
jgi:poly(A) polymerase